MTNHTQHITATCPACGDRAGHERDDEIGDAYECDKCGALQCKQQLRPAWAQKLPVVGKANA